MRWMLAPAPTERPTARDLLAEPPLRWVSTRRLAGATVFEGNWGSQGITAQVSFGSNASISMPADQSDVDTVMTDV